MIKMALQINGCFLDTEGAKGEEGDGFPSISL